MKEKYNKALKFLNAFAFKDLKRFYIRNRNLLQQISRQTTDSKKKSSHTFLNV